MDVVILAGGRGTRMYPSTELSPKPMLEVCGRPLLSHVMDVYRRQGKCRFLVLTGYLGEQIAHHYQGMSDVLCVETGRDTDTGGRLRCAMPVIQSDPFMLTYGDGVAQVDLGGLLLAHDSGDFVVTVTAVHPPSRFGELDLENGVVRHFTEKPNTTRGWVNGGFMVMDRRVKDYLSDDPGLKLSKEPFAMLAREGRLGAYTHEGAWMCADTVRELELMREFCEKGEGPWGS